MAKLACLTAGDMWASMACVDKGNSPSVDTTIPVTGAAPGGMLDGEELYMIGEDRLRILLDELERVAPQLPAGSCVGDWRVALPWLLPCHISMRAGPPALYRAHVTELLGRIVAGDIDGLSDPTRMEVLAGISEMSLRVPPDQRFVTLMGGLLAGAAPELVDELGLGPKAQLLPLGDESRRLYEQLAKTMRRREIERNPYRGAGGRAALRDALAGKAVYLIPALATCPASHRAVPEVLVQLSLWPELGVGA